MFPIRAAASAGSSRPRPSIGNSVPIETHEDCDVQPAILTSNLHSTRHRRRWSSVKRGRLTSCSWRTIPSSCRCSMTARCRRFIHPAKQTRGNDSGFIAKLSLRRPRTTSFALELTTSAPLAIPTISKDSGRSNFQTLRGYRTTPKDLLLGLVWSHA